MAGIAWTAVTAAAMFALAAGKARTGRALGGPVPISEGRVTLVDGILATAVLGGLVLNAAAAWWQADPLAALVIVVYALREAREIFLAGQWTGTAAVGVTISLWPPRQPQARQRHRAGGHVGLVMGRVTGQPGRTRQHCQQHGRIRSRR